MAINSFFDTLENHYNKNLPFVVYSRPINSIIKCWLQSDDTVHKTSDFTESGFVFSPFDLNEKSILFPVDNCQQLSIEVHQLDADNVIIENNINRSNKTNHLTIVKRGIEAIKKGELEKVVLSRQEEVTSKNIEPFNVFKRLFNTYKNAMVYCWYHPKVGLWLGATPELLFKVEGKKSTMISLAGTQPYSEKNQLSWTSKEYEEQQIVTDYIVDQIKPFANKIDVSEVETARAGNLLHLKSYIVSHIKNKCDLKSIIDALHPTPAVCGFPKNMAKDFIVSNENYNREYYTGFLGELNLKQSRTRNTNRRNVENNAYAVVKTFSNFYVNLRCMQIKDAKATIYVGGGITKDSDPEKEWEETVNKTKTMYSVLG